MKKFALFQRLPSHISLLVHSHAGPPIFFRINLRRCGFWLVSVSIVLWGCLMGTFLFFREMEVNRRLSDRVLELKLLQSFLQTPVQNGKTVIKDNSLMGTPTARQILSASHSEENSRNDWRASIADLNTECDPHHCEVELGLISTAPGLVKGQLLLIMETEVPRIGGNSLGASQRKKFLLYPGGAAKDIVSVDEVNQFETKPFKFSNKLQTQVSFALPNLLKPIAVNVYLFNDAKVLVHHQRHPIEFRE